MKPFRIRVMCDHDFGVRNNSWGTSSNIVLPKGISSISGGFCEINSDIFRGRNFWIPVSKFLSKYESINDIDYYQLGDFLSQFGKFEMENDTFIFNPDNDYDLEYIHLDNKDEFGRISFSYINCPLQDFYLIDEGSYIKILPSIFSKNYYTMMEEEWIRFLEALELDLSELRDIKLNQILGDDKPFIYQNIMRQLRFIVDYGKKGDKFLDSINSFYIKNGFVTDKQVSVVKSIIW